MAEQTKIQTNNQVISWSQTKIFLYISIGLFVLTFFSDYLQGAISLYFFSSLVESTNLFFLFKNLKALIIIFNIIFNFVFWCNTFQNSKKIYGFQKGMETWRVALSVILAPLSTYFLFQSFIRFHKKLITPRFDKLIKVYNFIWKIFLPGYIYLILDGGALLSILLFSSMGVKTVATILNSIILIIGLIRIVIDVVTYMLYFEMEKIQTTDKINYQKYLNSKSL